MELFLQTLICELELDNFGIMYEDLVPFVCNKSSISKYIRNHDSCVKEFSIQLSEHILKPKKITPEYTEFQNKIENIASFYWENIVEENREFVKIKFKYS